MNRSFLTGILVGAALLYVYLTYVKRSSGNG